MPMPTEINTRVRLAATFPADPTGVNIFIKSPGGAFTKADLASGIQRDGAGQYHFDLIVDRTWPWIYKLQATGAVRMSSSDTYITVKQTRFV
jgi:hypothetical protein